MLKTTCKETEIKLALRSFEAISKGWGVVDEITPQQRLGKKYAQPIVAQLFGEARRTIESAGDTYNERFNDAVRGHWRLLRSLGAISPVQLWQCRAAPSVNF